MPVIFVLWYNGKVGGIKQIIKFIDKSKKLIKKMEKIAKALIWIRKHNLYPDMPVLSSPHAPEVIVDGKKVLLFACHP